MEPELEELKLTGHAMGHISPARREALKNKEKYGRMMVVLI